MLKKGKIHEYIYINDEYIYITALMQEARIKAVDIKHSMSKARSQGNMFLRQDDGMYSMGRSSSIEDRKKIC
jgi:hypothetical protein